MLPSLGIGGTPSPMFCCARNLVYVSTDTVSCGTETSVTACSRLNCLSSVPSSCALTLMTSTAEKSAAIPMPACFSADLEPDLIALLSSSPYSCATFFHEPMYGSTVTFPLSVVEPDLIAFHPCSATFKSYAGSSHVGANPPSTAAERSPKNIVLGLTNWPSSDCSHVLAGLIHADFAFFFSNALISS